MTSEYPHDQQNPPTQPGARPGQQSAPQRRVPRRFEQAPGEPDPRGIDSGWTGGEHVKGFQEVEVEELEGTPASPPEGDGGPPNPGPRATDGAVLQTTGAKGGLEDLAIEAPSQDSSEVEEMRREAGRKG